MKIALSKVTLISVCYAHGKEQEIVKLDMKYYSHKVGVNVRHLEWCIKYRYRIFRKEEYKKLCEESLYETQRHNYVKHQEDVYQTKLTVF